MSILSFVIRPLSFVEELLHFVGAGLVISGRKAEVKGKTRPYTSRMGASLADGRKPCGWAQALRMGASLAPLQLPHLPHLPHLPQPPPAPRRSGGGVSTTPAPRRAMARLYMLPLPHLCLIFCLLETQV